MSVKKQRLGIALGLVLILSVVTLGIALAASSVNITSYTPSPDCATAGLYATWSNDDPNADAYRLAENLTRGGTNEVMMFSNLVTSGTTTLSTTGSINPLGSQANDIIRYTISWKDDSLNVLASDSITVNCTTGQIIRDKEKSEPYTGIYLLSSAEQAPYLSVPNASGAAACGVFNVNGWGAKYVGLADFPGCTAPVAVMCFNGDGVWTADNVTNVVMHGDWEVDFTSSQDGICGLFAQ